MEWGHRVLSRTISLAFVLPLAYFAARRRLGHSLRVPLLGMTALLGAQGALGWYMVRSGLKEPVARRGAAGIALPPRSALRHRDRALWWHVHWHALRCRRLALRV